MKNSIGKLSLFLSAFSTCMAGCKRTDEIIFPPNVAPVASSVNVSGVLEVDRTLTAAYVYSDADGDLESGSVFQWYIANDASGAGETAITGANTLTYLIRSADQNKYIRFGVKPKTTTGVLEGNEVRSSFVGAVGDATTVTFMYNGSSVTYNIISSAATGRKWLDRNLGAPNTPSSVDDYQNYGDLFQWGRAADGHQLINHTGPANTQMSGVNGTTTTLSSADTPANSLFILSAAAPSDWRNPQNSNLWQGVNGVNNPCPAGWRIPTREEWAAEGITNISDGFTKLKLTYTSFRLANDGSFSALGATQGNYHTSTVDPALDATRSIRVRYSSNYNAAVANRAGAYACKCIKN